MNVTEPTNTTILVNQVTESPGFDETTAGLIIIVLCSVIGSFLFFVGTNYLIRLRNGCVRKSAEDSAVTGIDNSGMVNIGGVSHDTKNWTEVQLQTLPKEVRTTKLRK